MDTTPQTVPDNATDTAPVTQADLFEMGFP